MKLKDYIYILIVFASISNSKGQNIDSLNLSSIHFFNIDSFFLQHNKVDSVTIDSTISSFHEYLSIDSLLSYQFLGSTGLTYRNLNMPDEDLLRSYKLNENFEYFLNNESLILTSNRLTNLQYVLGSKKEQFLKVLHSQNIIRSLNISINYQRLSSEGFLRRQNTKLSQFEFFPWYHTKNHKYSTYLLLSVRDDEIEENGGMTSDSSSLTLSDLNLLGINLLNAENNTRRFNLEFYQKLNFIKFNDNSRSFKHSIAHKLTYYKEKNSFTETDPTNEFYYTIYYNTSITQDILSINRLNNLLKYTFSPTNKISTSIYVINDLINLNQRSIDTLLNNSYAGAELNYSPAFVSLKGEYCFFGPSEESYIFNTRLNYKINNGYGINLEYIYKLAYPDLMFSLFQSNHFSWYNFLERTRTHDFNFSINAEGINTAASTRFLSLKHYTFFNEFVQPEQFGKQLNYISIRLRNILRFRKFGLESKGMWQQVSNTAIINLPELSLAGTLFYETKLFNNALQTKAGVEGHYMSLFKGDKYMPPLRQFYLQNEIDVAGYPQIDVFINFKVKTARIFLKVQNITSGGGDDFYYTVPYYPMPGRVFKLGINWMFFD